MAIRFQLKPRRNKYNNTPKVVDGIKFRSIKEADYYIKLKQRILPGGDVHFFLMQVPIRLPGGTVYRVDFLEFHHDGFIHFVDTKGKKTDSFNIKKREVEAVYPFEIETV